MSCMTYEELKKKDVINVCDGANIGRVCDIEIDVDDDHGCITALIVPGPARMFGLLRSEEELVIPYTCVQKFGEDVILVEIHPKRECD